MKVLFPLDNGDFERWIDTWMEHVNLAWAGLDLGFVLGLLEPLIWLTAKEMLDNDRSRCDSKRLPLLKESKHFTPVQSSNYYSQTHSNTPSLNTILQKETTEKIFNMPWSCCQCSATNSGGIVSTWCNSCGHNTSGCSNCFAYARHVFPEVNYRCAPRNMGGATNGSRRFG